MENKIIVYLFCFIMFSMSACSVNKSTKLETPFVTVVKLKAAEQSLHYEEALQYIDVVQVYSTLGSENPVEDWKQSLKFLYNIGKDKKNTNEFGYYDFDIEESVNGKNASVRFKAKDSNASIKMITYGLEKRQQKWVVVSIDYVK
ncbi:hypothetical protein FACS189430_12460 [Bacteroidia bacterium]|nr:hypothetical protein FACS189430_12460 [Bacteroidia bacterium]